MVRGCGHRQLAVHHNYPPVIVENVRVHLRRRTAAVVVNGQWHTSAWSTYNYPNPYIVRLEVNIKQLARLPIQGVWPHGALQPQSFISNRRRAKSLLPFTLTVHSERCMSRKLCPRAPTVHWCFCGRIARADV
eukprot:4563441-Prymnesium_polylepis.1